MITACSGNVAALVPTTFQYTNAFTIPKVGHCGVPTHLMCVRFAKLGSKSEDQSKENSNLLSI